MSDVVIRAEGLGKKYVIGHLAQRERYFSLRDSIARGLRTLARKAGDLVHGRPVIQGDELEEVWALADLDFEVLRGEVVGIIGRNGAGKSTLLKILSRITEPSIGRVRISGRVASLLEIGTGFHPELSGRENIFLNGAILGMGRAEIRRKFDEIVAFAEVERFLDTPVKRYSSGMYVRLAFAVAAHLEPEILIVDEVLAVGDGEFQKKCLGRMSEVARGGRTVFFVSHNMGAVQSLCTSGMVLDQGRIVFRGDAGSTIAAYQDRRPQARNEVREKSLGPALVLTRLEVEDKFAQTGDPVALKLGIWARERDALSDLAVLVHGPGGERVALIDLRNTSGPFRLEAGQEIQFECKVESLPLVEHEFSLGLYVSAESVTGSFMDLQSLRVLPGGNHRGVLPRDPQFRGVVELRATIHSQMVSR
jgi:ABC-type polysaccharide/polyol phosphate transport system ATPase subunit